MPRSLSLFSVLIVTCVLAAIPSSASAGLGVASCQSVTRWVAPGGRVEVPLNCTKADGYPDPGFVRELRGTTLPVHGTILLSGRPVVSLPLPDLVMPDVPGSVVFSADKSEKDDRFLFGAHNDDLTAGSSMDAEAKIQVDTSGKFAPNCDDVKIEAKSGEPTQVPLQCSMDGLILSAVSPAQHGVVNQFDTAKQTAIYTANQDYTGSDQFIYVGEKTGQTSNEAKVDILVVPVPKKPDDPPKSDVKPPVCQDVIERVTISFPMGNVPVNDEDDPFNPKTPYPLKLQCKSAENSPLKYEIISPLKWGSLKDLNTETGSVNWHYFDWSAWEKAGAKKDDEPPYRNFPEEVPDDPDDQTKNAEVEKVFWGWNEAFQYRAVDQHTGAVSNTATFTVQERDGFPCKFYSFGEIQVGKKKRPASYMFRCQGDGKTWKTMDVSNEKNNPFTLEKASPESCVNLQAAPRMRQRSMWRKVTAASRVRLVSPGVIARTDTKKAQFALQVKGKRQVFPNPPRGEWKKPFTTVSAAIDGRVIYFETNRLPVKFSLPAALLKAGRHTLKLSVSKFTPPKKGDSVRSVDEDMHTMRTKVIAKIPFVVLDCGAAKLTAAQQRANVALTAGSGGLPLNKISFRLPNIKRVKLATLVIGKQRFALKRRGAIRLKKAGIVARVQGKQLVITGLPAKTTTVKLVLAAAKGQAKRRYQATLTSISGKRVTVRAQRTLSK